MMLLISSAIFCITISFLAIIEGFLYHFSERYKNTVERGTISKYESKNLHGPLFLIRLFVGIVALLSNINCSGWPLFILAISMLLQSEFFHLGFYYKTRNLLNPKVYKRGFKDTNVIEAGDSSRFDLWLNKFGLKQITYNKRLIAFVVGSALLLFSLFQ